MVLVQGAKESKLPVETLSCVPQVGDAVAYEDIRGRVEERRFNYLSETEVQVRVHIRHFPEMVV